MIQYRLIVSLLLLSISLTLHSQTSKSKFVGKYSDAITVLTINPDSTFELSTPDNVFPYTYKTYYNRGVWTDSGNVLTLNPEKVKRQPSVSLIEKNVEGSDSIQIKINYLTETYQNEILVNTTPADFNMLTLYVNGTKNYRYLVHEHVRRVCSFSPKVRREVVVDSSNLVVLPKQKIDKLGIYSYGFTVPIEINTVNANSNYFEVTVVQPVDTERMPRNKKVIFKGSHAYLYEYGGKIPTSGFVVDGLKKAK